MIISFQDKETKKIWNQQFSRKFPKDYVGLSIEIFFLGMVKQFFYYMP